MNRALDALLVDLKYAIRSLRSRLRFSAMIAGILAVAVASVTIVYSIVDIYLLSPSVIGNTERLGWVFGVDTRRTNNRALVSIPDYLDFRDRSQSFEMLAARAWDTATLTGHGQATRLFTLLVTANQLPVWDIRLALGRPFQARDEAPGAPAVAILNYAFWRNRLAGDAAIVGGTISLDGEPVSVIGVLDPRYNWGALGATDVWRPLRMDDGRHGPRDSRTLSVVGLLRPGVDVRRANEEIHTIAMQLQREHPATHAGWDARVVNTRVGRTGPQTYYNLGLLAVAALLVLVIACVNVALLLLARAVVRQRELMVRVAVGAPWWRVIVQHGIEGLLMAIPGAALGICVAIWVILGLKGRASFARLSIDWPIFTTAALVSLLAPLIFAMIPAVGTVARSSLRFADWRGFDSSRTARRQQRALATIQVASALTLLIVAGLVVRSFLATLTADFGLKQKNLLNVALTLPAWKFKQPEQLSRFFTDAVDQVAAIANVSSVAATSSVPGLESAGPPRAVRLDTGDASEQLSQLIAVTPRTFETLGVRLLAGREFSITDSRAGPLVVVINRRLAETLSSSPPERLVGRKVAIRGEPRWREIVGIVGDTRDADFDSFPPLLYLPHTQEPQRTMTLLVRTTRRVSPKPVTDALFSVDPDVAPYQIRTFEEGVSASIAATLTLFGLFGAMAAAAALLAAVGMFGVFACIVGQRMREFGIRHTVGATAGQLRALVFREGWRTVLPGMAIGMLGGAALSRYAVGALYAVRIDPLDPVTYVACVAFLIAACALALWIPARRAARAGSTVADLLR